MRIVDVVDVIDVVDVVDVGWCGRILAGETVGGETMIGCATYVG